MTNLSLTDINTSVNCEPRVLDTKLATALGFKRPVKIRESIERHRSALERLGTIPTVGTVKRGQPATEYYLSEKQALYLCTKSQTEKAIEVTIHMVELFYQVRNGLKPVPTISDYGWQVSDPYRQWQSANDSSRLCEMQVKAFSSMLGGLPIHPMSRAVIEQHLKHVQASASASAAKLEGLRPVLAKRAPVLAISG